MMVVSGYWLQITPPSDHLISLNIDANYFIVRIFDYTLILVIAAKE